MSALVTHVWTVELAPTEWMGSRAAVYRDSVEHGVKQVSVYMPEILWRSCLKHSYRQSRAAQSNSVYVSLLKIPDSVSKSLIQKCCFPTSGHLLARGKLLVSRQIMDTNRNSAHQFCDLFSWARFRKWGRIKRKTTRKETRRQRRHDALHCPRVKCNNHFWYCFLLFASDFMHNSTGYFTQEARVALGYRLGKLLRFFRGFH